MFSQWLLNGRIAKSAAALERIAIAKNRILSILDRETVAHEKTLEQKISDQGPYNQRVDPHLVSLAIKDMQELNRIAVHHHQATDNISWYANIGTPAQTVADRLHELAPLYRQVSATLSNVIGDALEIATFQALKAAKDAKPRHHFEGYYYLDKPKNQYGRFQQKKAPTELNGRTTNLQPDFLQHGHDAGTLCIECKNYREWLYPQKDYIKHHILRCDQLNAIPVIIARRIHYSTISNFFLPAGIIAHEALYQYFPSDQHQLAMAAKHKKSLGFTDIRATEDADPRTIKFFTVDLPRIVTPMTENWHRNREYLVAYAKGDLNLAQLYTKIGSRAGGKWIDFPDDTPPELYEL